ncbi:aldo/keto reductase [Bacteroidota bacterium]
MRHACTGRDDRESIASLHRAQELGINFWDTVDIYENGDNKNEKHMGWTYRCFP